MYAYTNTPTSKGLHFLGHDEQPIRMLRMLRIYSISSGDIIKDRNLHMTPLKEIGDNECYCKRSV